MEVFGLAAGILPLFKTCLDYFQLYKTAQASERDTRILLYKLDCEHERFLIWGEKHGAFEEHPADECNTALGLSDKVPKIEEALKLIQELLSDAKELREKYGVTVSTATGEQALSQVLYPSNWGLKRLKWHKRAQDPQSHGLVQKTVWAINDKAKFKELIIELRELVESLYNVLPVPPEERYAVAVEDIEAIAGDLEMLADFEIASQKRYPEWSSAASVMREAGSTISQWVSRVGDDAEPQGNSDQTTMDDAAKGKNDKDHGALPFNQGRLYYGSPIFIFTRDCLSSTPLNCALERSELDPNAPRFVFMNDEDRKWGLGNRITEIVNPKLNSTVLDTLAMTSPDLQDSLSDIIAGVIKSLYPSSRVWIYCAPCRCALRTALLICQQQSKDIIEYQTRVDDRIPCSCCESEDKLGRLQAIHKTICDWDMGLVDGTSDEASLAHMDREWIEARIYMLETESNYQHSHGDEKAQITKLIESFFYHKPHGHTSENSLFLGEASRCSWIVRTRPFPWSSRVPKANEIFRFSPVNPSPLKLKSEYKGTFTSPPVSVQQISSSLQVPTSKTIESSGE